MDDHPPRSELLQFTVPGARSVSARLLSPPRARAAFICAHGAGAGMDHPFLQAIADRLAAHGLASLRYQFPYMESGSKRPDAPAVAQAAVRAAVAEAARRWPELPLFAGGKSFGGRMTSQAQAAQPLPGVRGLVFLGFPLHPADRPSRQRAEHLPATAVPLLFLQGTRDKLAHLPLIEAVCAELSPRATLHRIPEADHAFHVPVRSGRTDADVQAELAATIATWCAG